MNKFLSWISFNLLDISKRLNISLERIIKFFFKRGIILQKNQWISKEQLLILAKQMNKNISFIDAKNHSINSYLRTLKRDNFNDQWIYFRPLLITLVGHINHGKTSLFEHLTSTSNIVKWEKFKITQWNRFWYIQNQDHSFILIDTPGHFALNHMRHFSMNISDINIIVISLKEGIKNETRSIFQYIIKHNLYCMIVFTFYDAVKKDELLTWYEWLSKEEIFNYDRLLFSDRWIAIDNTKPFLSILKKSIKDAYDYFKDEWRINNNQVNSIILILDKFKDHHIKYVDAICIEGMLKIRQNLFSIYGKKIGVVKKITSHVKYVDKVRCCWIIGLQNFPNENVLISIDKYKENKFNFIKRYTLDSRYSDVSAMYNKINVIIKSFYFSSSKSIKDNLCLYDWYNILSSGIGCLSFKDVELAKRTNSMILIYHSKFLNKEVLWFIKHHRLDYCMSDNIYTILSFCKNYKTNNVDTIIKPIAIANIKCVFSISNMIKVAGCQFIKFDNIEFISIKKKVWVYRYNKFVSNLLNIDSIEISNLSTIKLKKDDEFGIKLYTIKNKLKHYFINFKKDDKLYFY